MGLKNERVSKNFVMEDERIFGFRLMRRVKIKKVTL